MIVDRICKYFRCVSYYYRAIKKEHDYTNGSLQRCKKVNIILNLTLKHINYNIKLELLYFLCYIIENIYTVNETTKKYSWLAALAILILLFVLYRNKLQFSGWYKGKGRKILPRKVSVVLISLSVILVITPFILSSLLG